MEAKEAGATMDSWQVICSGRTIDGYLVICLGKTIDFSSQAGHFLLFFCNITAADTIVVSSLRKHTNSVSSDDVYTGRD